MKKKLFLMALALIGFAGKGFSQEYTFPLSDKVDHQKVSFKNRYGITLVGDMYVPKGQAGEKLPDRKSVV